MFRLFPVGHPQGVMMTHSKGWKHVGVFRVLVVKNLYYNLVHLLAYT